MTEVIPEAPVAATEQRPVVPARHRKPPVEDVEESRWLGLAVLVGLIAFLGVAAGWEYIVVVLLLMFMIFMHELGHYLAARRGGMKATEFFLGFGPKLWSFRRGETEYGIKGIWAGAYVKVIGMNNLDEVDPVDEPRTYRQASYPKRMLVAVAGSGMHFLMALVAIYAVLVFSGLERDPVTWAVAEISEDSSADAIGLEAGDRIVGGDGQEFETFDDMRLFVEPRAGAAVTFDVLRDGEVVIVSGTLGVNDETGNGLLGVRTNGGDFQTVGVVDAVPETLEVFGTLTKATVTSIVQIFSPSGLIDFFGRVGGDDAVTATGEVVEQDNEGRVLSLVGATRLGAQLTGEGIAGLLVFFFSINIFVGVFNLAPLLPLDGGHVVIGTYERLRSRRGHRYHADVAKALPIAYLVMLVLASVGLVAIYLDIADPINL
jgi:membrane-associated protease RseP (regulator of RpoE activity)